MLIEYIYGVIFFVMPIVGMFVAVVVAGIKNMRNEEYVEENNYIEYSNYIKKDRYEGEEWSNIDKNGYQEKKEKCVDKKEKIITMQPAIIINMNDWAKKKVMNKLSTTINNQVAMHRCIGESLTCIDYGLASAILTVKRRNELASWLRQNRKKDLKHNLVDDNREHKEYISKFKKFSFIKRYKFRRQRIRAGP